MACRANAVGVWFGVCCGLFLVLAPSQRLGAAPRPAFDDKALAALRARAQAGNASAQHQLGRHYYYEYDRFLGRRQEDLAQAVHFWRMAALQGHARSQVRLGDCHSQGWGMKVDLVTALHWYRKAAAQGDADAQMALCAVFEFGVGVPVDKKQAHAWRTLALAQHHPIAQHEQGQMLLLERRDEAGAVKWFRLAAEQDHVPSQNQLGLCYQEGRGVKKDLIESYAWQHLSADTHGLSRKWRDEAARRMDAAQIAAGKARAAQLRMQMDAKDLAERRGAEDDRPNGEP